MSLLAGRVHWAASAERRTADYYRDQLDQEASLERRYFSSRDNHAGREPRRGSANPGLYKLPLRPGYGGLGFFFISGEADRRRSRRRWRQLLESEIAHRPLFLFHGGRLRKARRMIIVLIDGSAG